MSLGQDFEILMEDRSESIEQFFCFWFSWETILVVGLDVSRKDYGTHYCNG